MPRRCAPAAHRRAPLPPPHPRPALRPLPKDSAIPQATLEAMRAEFEYWYPFGLRVGGFERGFRGVLPGARAQV